MDFHAASGWLDTQVARGTGFPDIDQAPSQITIGHGEVALLHQLLERRGYRHRPVRAVRPGQGDAAGQLHVR